MDFLGSDPTTTTFPTQTGQQSDLINNLLKMASGKLTSGQFDFGPIEQQARTNFTQSTIPSITEMFNDPGGEGLRSSGFQGAVGRAGSDLESNLAAMKANYNLQEQGLMQNLVGAGMQPQFDTHHEPGSSPLGGMGGILGALGMAKLFGGMGGGAAAGAAGAGAAAGTTGTAGSAAAAGGLAGGIKSLLGSLGGAAASPQGAAVLGTVIAVLALKSYLDNRRKSAKAAKSGNAGGV